MRAYFIDAPGAPFRGADIARPRPSSGQVLIRIQASGLNPLDAKIRLGKADHAKQPFPAVLGLDMAGVVEETRANAGNFQLGDEVYGLVGGVGGLQGTLAEFVVADVDLLAHKPATLSMREAAALPLSLITAWQGLVDRARVRPGHRVLVHAGAGGVGHIAVQLARAFGAEVFATVSSEKVEVVKTLGATPIDYRTSSVDEYVAAHTDGQGFDIVYDTLGGTTLDASFIAAKRYTGHVLSSLGWGTHSLAPLSFRGATYSGVFTLFPLISGEGRAHHGEILREAATLVQAGKLKPLLHAQHFSASDLDVAFALVESGSLGKVVIEM